MVTGLKVSSLTCNCVFYRPEQNTQRAPPMELHFEGVEIKK